MNMTTSGRAERRHILLQGLSMAAWLGGMSAVRANTGGQRWRLARVEVLESGRSQALPDGDLRDGIVLQANAVGEANALVPQGLLVLRAQAFSPRQAHGEQQPGRWYLQGQWLLAPPELVEAGLQSARRLPGVLRGQLRGELPAGPEVRAGVPWRVELRIPATTFTPRDREQHAQPVSGDGTLVFDADAGGELSLNLRPLAYRSAR